MGRLACLPVFNRKNKPSKMKGMGEDSVQNDLLENNKLLKVEQVKRFGENPEQAFGFLNVISPSTSSDSCHESITNSVKEFQHNHKETVDNGSACSELMPVVNVEAPSGLSPSLSELVLVPEFADDRKLSDLILRKSVSCDALVEDSAESAFDTDRRPSGCSDYEGLSLSHSGKLPMNLLEELVLESEDDSEVSDSESYKGFPNSVGLPGGGISPDTGSAFYYESPTPGVADTHFAGFSKADESPGFNIMVADRKDSISTVSARLAGSQNTHAFSTNKSDRVLSDEEVLAGHISDPGVYHREELRSTCDSPILHGNHSMAPSESRISSSPGKADSDQGDGDFKFCNLNSSAQQSLPRCTLEDGGESAEVNTSATRNSPLSDLTCRSADQVLIKPESSSKVLTFQKRKSWWRVFMFSHRNLHRKVSFQSTSEPRVGKLENASLADGMTGYTSDTCDGGLNCAGSAVDLHQVGTRSMPTKAALTEQESDKAEQEHHNFLGPGAESASQINSSGATAFWPTNEWISFSSEQHNFKRVEEWVSSIEPLALLPEENSSLYEIVAAGHDRSPSPNSTVLENQREPEGLEDPSATPHETGVLTSDIELANAAVRSLTAFSTVAHVSGIGLRVVPSLGIFSSLKTLNLSANCIVRITSGSLPRSLHSLDLSRNRIAVIEGLRELTRLRVLNLSYNRISRIGHGLANCTLIKELYIAANKISEVEGLYRLLKLSVLDLSFNRLTTSKSLGQLAANYNSLLALNLLGNPVHTNLGEEQLRKLVISLAPHVTYLNRQPIKTVSAREVVVDSVARAALGVSQRGGKSSSSRASRRGVGTSSTSLQKKPSPGHRRKEVDKRRGNMDIPGAERASKHHHHSNGKVLDKGKAREYTQSSKAEQLLRKHVVAVRQIGNQGMHRSMSEGALQDQN